MAEMGDELNNNIGKRIIGTFIIITIVAAFGILFLYSALAWFFGDYILSIVVFLFTTGLFFVTVISSIEKEKAHVYNATGYFLCLIGIFILFSQFLFDKDIGKRIFGLIMVIITSIFISIILYFGL